LTMSDDKYKAILTPEEQQMMESFCREASQKTTQIFNLFTTDTRGFMLFMFAMHLLQQKHPALLKVDAPERVAEWMAAGAPEDVKEVVPRILERVRKEADEAGRQSGTNWN